jgi:hypothetical protein
MSEIYTLKEAVPDEVLRELNRDVSLPVQKIFLATDEFNTYPDMDELDDWIAAVKSGKKIVNPMTPREELKKYYDGMCYSVESRAGNPFYPKQLIECAVEIIAKEHPDVSGWLEEDDPNA